MKSNFIDHALTQEVDRDGLRKIYGAAPSSATDHTCEVLHCQSKDLAGSGSVRKRVPSAA